MRGAGVTDLKVNQEKARHLFDLYTASMSIENLWRCVRILWSLKKTKHQINFI